MHGGGISFDSSDGMTVFSVNMPLNIIKRETKIA
jgi:nitrogen-specific signal transduction histidine kinase